MQQRAQETNTRGGQQARGAAFLAVTTLGLLGFGVFGLAPKATAARPTAARSQNQSVIIPISGMSCAACAGRVKKTLRAVSGVNAVEVRLGQRNARVEYRAGQVTPEKLVSEINKLGYRAGKPTSGG